jgi:hypothetical protein
MAATSSGCSAYRSSSARAVASCARVNSQWLLWGVASAHAAGKGDASRDGGPRRSSTASLRWFRAERTERVQHKAHCRAALARAETSTIAPCPSHAGPASLRPRCTYAPLRREPVVGRHGSKRGAARPAARCKRPSCSSSCTLAAQPRCPHPPAGVRVREAPAAISVRACARGEVRRAGRNCEVFQGDGHVARCLSVGARLASDA